MWENKVLLGEPDNCMNSMTSREANCCHTVVDVYNALSGDLISCNLTVVLISQFFVPQDRTDSSVRA